MTTRTHLPYDFARCNGKTVEGQLVKSCNTCARQHFRLDVSEFRQPWIQGQVARGHCPDHIDMEYSDE